MGILDNSTQTVDAVLTQLGRKRLAENAFNVTKFALSDDEVDYTLWNDSHPSGSLYYGEVIENMPVTEATMYTTLRSKLKRTKSTLVQGVITVNGASNGSTLDVNYTATTTDALTFEIYQFPIISTQTGESFNVTLEIPNISGEIDDSLRKNVWILNSPWNFPGGTAGPRGSISNLTSLKGYEDELIEGYLEKGGAGRSDGKNAAVASSNPYIWLLVFGNNLINEYGASSYTADYASISVQGRTSGAVSTYPLQFTFTRS